MRSDTIMLAKNFSMVAAGGQVMRGDWLNLNGLGLAGSEHQNAVLHVHCQTIDPTGAANGIRVQARTSYDTAEDLVLGTPLNVTAPGSQDAAIAANLEEWVRVEFDVQETFQMMGIFSVWLQLKRA